MANPRVGDSVWIQRHDDRDRNGIIDYIDWLCREVHVSFYGNHEPEVYEMFQFDVFNDRLNQWILLH